jgi:hypothetical protein
MNPVVEINVMASTAGHIVHTKTASPRCRPAHGPHVTPAGAVGPVRQGADEQQYKYDDDDSR